MRQTAKVRFVISTRIGLSSCQRAIIARSGSRLTSSTTMTHPGGKRSRITGRSP